MLTTVASSAIKMKNQVKNLKQTELSTERSHKLGSVPKYVGVCSLMLKFII